MLKNKFPWVVLLKLLISTNLASATSENEANTNTGVSKQYNSPIYTLKFLYDHNSFVLLPSEKINGSSPSTKVVSRVKRSEEILCKILKKKCGKKGNSQQGYQQSGYSRPVYGQPQRQYSYGAPVQNYGGGNKFGGGKFGGGKFGGKKFGGGSRGNDKFSQKIQEFISKFSKKGDQGNQNQYGSQSYGPQSNNGGSFDIKSLFKKGGSKGEGNYSK